MITVINTIRATILTIITITTTMATSHGKKSVKFVAKKAIALISIQTMSNEKQKNFGDKIKNFEEIKANTIFFWLIIKVI